MHSLAQVNISNAYFNSHPGAKNLGASPGSLISSLLPNVLVVAGLIFFFIIVYSGFNIIVTAGTSPSPQLVAKHKATFTYALVGFLIIITGFFILQIVGVVTTGGPNILINTPANL